MTNSSITRQGGCTCGDVRLVVTAAPMIVHCCHCRMCQRQTGSAFVINALLGVNNVRLLSGQVEELVVATPSRLGQTIARCFRCQVAVWSSYCMHGLGKHIRFVRVGTLDDPAQCPPDIHIYTSSKQPWMSLPSDHPTVPKFYDIDKTWSPDSLARRLRLPETTGITLP